MRDKTPRRFSLVTSRIVAWAAAGLFVALGVAGGLLVHSRLPETYRAGTTVLVLPTQGGQDSSLSGSRAVTQVQIETEAELARSAQVASAASERLGGAASSDVLLANSSVTVPINSQVMVISFEAGKPAFARDGSMALAEAYLKRRTDQAEAALAEVVKSLQAQLADATNRLEGIKSSKAVNRNERAFNESQRILLVDQIAEINSRLVTLRFANAQGGEIITEAALPRRPVSPKLLVDLGGGLLIGLVLAAATLLLHDHLRRGRTFATPKTVPVLGTVTLDDFTTEPGSTNLPVLRGLCRIIAAHEGDAGPVVVAGLGDAPLRHRFSVALASSWAEEFGSSVLVDAEPEGEVTAGSPGLLDILRGEADALDCAKPLTGRGSSIVPFGILSGSAPSTIERALLPAVWIKLESSYHSVVVHVGDHSDDLLARSILRTAGRIVLVADERVARTRDLSATTKYLERLGLTDLVVGMVVILRAGPGRGVESSPIAAVAASAPRSVGVHEGNVDAELGQEAEVRPGWAR